MLCAALTFHLSGHAYAALMQAKTSSLAMLKALCCMHAFDHKFAFEAVTAAWRQCSSAENVESLFPTINLLSLTSEKADCSLHCATRFISEHTQQGAIAHDKQEHARHVLLLLSSFPRAFLQGPIIHDCDRTPLPEKPSC